jgi:glycosyltransferase involved in cell wall biosynthesis
LPERAPKLAPRIIHVIPDDGIGGVEVAARSMAARGDLACQFELLWIAGATLGTSKARMIFTGYRSSLNPLAHLAALVAIVRRSPDVVILSLWRTAMIGLFVRLLRPRTILVAFLHFEGCTHLVDRLCNRLLVAVAHEVWADSPATLSAKLRADDRRGRSISFVTERLAPPARTLTDFRPRFLLWARIHRQKGIDRAVSLIDQLVNLGVDATFDIWGPDAGEQARLQADIDQRSLTNRIRFKGPTDRARLAAIAADASFFLQPSRSEGMSIACVEAMQLGLIPVVTAVGEMATYVRDGETGIIVDPADISRAAQRICKLLGNYPCLDEIQSAATSFWHAAPLYADDVCRAAAAAYRGDKG